MYVPKRLTKFISMLCVVALIVTLIPAEAVMAATPGYYDIKFNANGLKDVSNLPSKFSVASGALFSIPSQKPTRKNFVFEGYDTSSTAKSVKYKAGQGNLRASGSLTLYPVWTAVPGNYRVTFSKNGLTDVTNMPSDFSVASGGTCSIPAQTPSRTGYDFLGYDTSSVATNVKYKAGQKNVKLTTNLTLYPVWKVKIYKVRLFSSADATTPIATEQYGYKTGLPVALAFNGYAGAIPAGYHAREWYNKKTNKKITGSIAVTSDLDIYYKDIPNTCTVKFMVDNKSVGTVTLKTGDVLNKVMPNPTKYGYLFVGWGIEKASFLKGIYQAEHTCCFEKDGETATYYAQFITTEKKQSVQVKYIMNIQDLERALKAYEYIVSAADSKIKSDEYINKVMQNVSKGTLGVASIVVAISPVGTAAALVAKGTFLIAGLAIGNLDYTGNKVADTMWYNRVCTDQKILLEKKREMKAGEERKILYSLTVRYDKLEPNPRMEDPQVEAYFLH